VIRFSFWGDRAFMCPAIDRIQLPRSRPAIHSPAALLLHLAHEQIHSTAMSRAKRDLAGVSKARYHARRLVAEAGRAVLLGASVGDRSEIESTLAAYLGTRDRDAQGSEP